MTRALLLAAAVLLVAVAGCGGAGKSSAGATTTVTTGTAPTKFEYSSEVTQNYMKSCTASPKATPAYCRCTLDKLSEHVSMKDFQQIGLSGGHIPTRVRNVIVHAAKSCRSKL